MKLERLRATRHRAMGMTIAATAVLALASCGKNSMMDSNGSCDTYFDPALTDSPAQGKITFGGRFPAGETVTVTYTDNQGVTQSQTPTSSDGTTLALAGVPSGTHQFTFKIKCPKLTANGEEFTYTIMVK